MKCTETKYFQCISNGFWWGAGASGLLPGNFRVSFWFILQRPFRNSWICLDESWFYSRTNVDFSWFISVGFQEMHRNQVFPMDFQWFLVGRGSFWTAFGSFSGQRLVYSATIFPWCLSEFGWVLNSFSYNSGWGMVHFGRIPRNVQNPSISNGFLMVSGGARQLLDCFRVIFVSAFGIFCNNISMIAE